MKSFVIQNEYFIKNYDSYEVTFKEFLSMKMLKNIAGTIKVNDYVYRSVFVHKIIRDKGYYMELIDGSTLSELFWKKKDYSLFRHVGIWIALYSNNFYDTSSINRINDFTTHNIMISKNNEVILIDQGLVATQNQSIEGILFYLIMRQDFEQLLHFQFTFKHIYNTLKSYFCFSIHGLNHKRVIESIEFNKKRLKRKLKNTPVVKRTIIRLSIELSSLRLLLYLAFIKIIHGNR